MPLALGPMQQAPVLAESRLEPVTMQSPSPEFQRLTAVAEAGLARTMSTSLHYLSASGPAVYKRQAIKEAEQQQRVMTEKLAKLGLQPTGYKFVELIGKGAYGRVYKSEQLSSRTIVAIKVLETDAMDFNANAAHKDGGMQDALKEIEVLQRLKQSKAVNINQFIEAFQVHSQLWIVSEYCSGGSLTTLRRASNNKTSERHIVPIARELARGLKSVHEAGIIHRDVKCSNVMINERGEVELIDFGVAGILLSHLDVDKRKTVIGTPHWMAPEMKLDAGEVAHGTEVDVWAFGITLYECAMGAPPNARTQNLRELQSRLRSNAPRLTEDRFSDGLKDIVAYALNPDPAARPSMAQICQHKYIADTEISHPTDSLKELVEAYYLWERSGGQRYSLFMAGGAAKPQHLTTGGDGPDEEWNFSTTAKFEADHLEESLYQDPSGGPEAMLSTSPPRTSDEFDAFPQATTRHAIENEPSLRELLRADPGRASTASSRHPSTSRRPTLGREPSTSRSKKSGGSGDASAARTIKAIREPSTSRGTTSSAKTSGDTATERRVARGANALQGLFDANASPYKYSYGSSSDLPLRTSDSSSSLHRKEVSVGSTSGGPPPAQINLDNIHAKKAEKRATMAWKWEDNLAPQGSDSAGGKDPATSATQDEKKSTMASPPRPPLKHAATMPVPQLDRPVSNTLDLDALLGGDSFAHAPPPTFHQQERPATQHAEDRQQPTGEMTPYGGSFLMHDPPGEDDLDAPSYTMRAADPPRSTPAQHARLPVSTSGALDLDDLYAGGPDDDAGAGAPESAWSMPTPHAPRHQQLAYQAPYTAGAPPQAQPAAPSPPGVATAPPVGAPTGLPAAFPAGFPAALPADLASLPASLAGMHLPPPIPAAALAADASPETLAEAFSGALGNWMGVLQQQLDVLTALEDEDALAAALGFSDAESDEDADAEERGHDGGAEEDEGEDDEEDEEDEEGRKHGGGGGGDFGEPGEDVGRHEAASETDESGYGTAAGGSGGWSAAGFAAGMSSSVEGSDAESGFGEEERGRR